MRIGPAIYFACVAPLLIAAAEPVRLQPSSKWVVDYAENSCRLVRAFGEGRSQTTFTLESVAPDDMQMIVTGRPLSTSRKEVSAKFLPVGSKEFSGKVAETTRGDPAIFWLDVPIQTADVLAKTEREREQRKANPGARPPAIPLAERTARRASRQQFAEATTEIEIHTSDSHPVILETGSLGPALAALDKCNRDSLEDWGVDPEIEDKIVRPAWVTNAGAILSSYDYPMEMVRQEKESTVTARLLVDESGKVTKCTSLSHYKEEEFNRITCDKISRRARFEPAELSDGTKVPSYFAFNVTFRLWP